MHPEVAALVVRVYVLNLAREGDVVLDFLIIPGASLHGQKTRDIEPMLG